MKVVKELGINFAVVSAKICETEKLYGPFVESLFGATESAIQSILPFNLKEGSQKGKVMTALRNSENYMVNVVKWHYRGVTHIDIAGIQKQKADL